MSERLEQLLGSRPEQMLTSAERHELLSLVRGSEALCRIAAGDRIIDRLLRESYKAPLDADLVLKAIARQPSELPDRTMVELDRCPPPGVPAIDRGRRALIWLWHLLTGDRSRAWRFALGFSLIAISVGILWFGKRQPQQMTLGEFTVAVGEPTVRHSGKRSTQPAARSTAVRLGDRIETGDADRAEVQFNDGTTLRMHFNTVVDLPTPKPETRNSKESSTPHSALQRPPEITLLAGQVWTKVQKTTNAPQYAVRTPVAAAIARGTEFGLKLSRSTNASTQTRSPIPDTRNSDSTNLFVTLTVKEGAVDFTNSFGSVQATAMTESTARADSAPTEPKRLQTLQVVQVTPESSWSLITSALTLPAAAEKLVGGGGWAGFALRDFEAGSDAPGDANSGTSNEVRVARVFQASPAGRLGLRIGEMVVALDGRPVTNAAQVERAMLMRPNAGAALTLRSTEGERLVALTVTNRPSLVPGPALTPAERTELANLTRELVGNVHVAPTFQAAKRSATDPPVEKRRYDSIRPAGSKALQAATQNNLGVILESDDALGPAIRAYGRAAYADPKVSLYRFNLGLALRKIGSFERSLEEFEQSARLAPESTDARKRLAEIHSLLGHDGEALTQTETALRSDPRDHGLWELRAQLLSKQHRFAEAQEAARQAVELDPDCPVAHSYVAGALHNQMKFAEAEAAYRKALDLAPFSAPLHMNLGTVQRDRQQLWPAEQSFRKATELQPDLALAFRNLGNALSDGNDFTQAAAALRKSLELDPDDGGVHRDLGQVFLKQRKFDDAEKSFLQAVEVFPSDAEAYYGLGQAHRERRQYTEAAQMYRKAIELKSDYANAHTGLGLVFYARGQFDEAEKFYRQAIELDPKECAPYHNLAEIYRQTRRQPEEAEALYRKSIELSPDRAGSYSGLGLVIAQRGDLAEAERLLRKARELEPDSSIMNNNLGEVLRRRGQIDEAARYYRKALALDPNNLSPYSNLGIIHAKRREFGEAEKLFRGLLDRAPASRKPAAYVNLANVYGEQGKLEEAEKLFRLALAMGPNRPDLCNSFASFLAEHNLKLDEALNLSRRAVQAAPNDPNNLDTLGWVLLQSGELDEAEKTLKKALELAGEDPPANDIREHLKKVGERKGTPPK